LFDPHDILELLPHTRGFDADRITALLMSIHLGALQV